MLRAAAVPPAQAAAAKILSDLDARPVHKTDLSWVSWQLASVLLFVILGAGKALAVAASVLQDGSLPYDSAAAVTWAEAIKLTFSFAWVAINNRQEVSLISSRRWFAECADMLMIAALFAVTNELNFLILQRLGAGLFVILSNLKIVFTCIFMRFLLHRHFAPLQWLAVAGLTFSAIVVKAPAVLGRGAETFTPEASIGLAFLLVSTACSGLGHVVYELVLKRSDDAIPMPFMAKNMVLYFWGLCINMVSWWFWGQHSLTEGFNRACVASILCLVGLGLSMSVIVRYMDNVIRCFSAVAQVLVTIMLSRLVAAGVHEGSFDIFYALGMVLLSVALVLYQQHDSPKLGQHLFLAVVCAVCGAGVCTLLEWCFVGH